MNDLEISQIADKFRIVETINRFGMAIDLHNWEDFRDLFTDLVEFDYSSIGEESGILSPDDIVKTASQDLGNFQSTQHLISNHQVELLENVATCYAHVRAQHFLPNDRGESTFEMGGHYTAGLIHAESDWKIKRWKFSFLWSCGNEELFSIARNRL